MRGVKSNAAALSLLACLTFACVPLPGSDPAQSPDPATQSVQSPAADFAQGTGVLTKTGRFYSGTVIASDPSIEPAAGGLVMAYTDLDLSTGRTVIARAVSADGNSWQPEGRSGGVRGLTIAGISGAWDENVESAELVRKGSAWELFFAGYRDAGNPMKGFPAALWLATSNDGVTFDRVSPDPVMQPTKGWYDNDAIYSPTILLEGGTYHMIYVGHAYTDTSQISAGGVYLLHATSSDGRTWTKSSTPIASPAQFDGWRREGVAEPWLVRNPAGGYLLFYTGLGGEDRAIGVATGASPAGPWDFGSKPLLTPGAPGDRDGHQVLAPSVLVEGDVLRMWYLAADSQGALTVGQAEGSVSAAITATR